MGVLNSLNPNESELMCRMYAESAKMMGTPCMYHEIVNEEKRANKHYDNDPVRTYSDPVRIDILLETQVSKVRGEKVNESDDTSQDIFIPKYDAEGNKFLPVKYSIVEVIQDFENSEYNIKYEISEVKTDMLHPVYWKCTISPYKAVLDIDPNTEGLQTELGGDGVSAPRFLNYKKEMK